MKAWMIREICKAVKDCRCCPLNAKYIEDNRCISFQSKYRGYPESLTGDMLLTMFEDEEEY